jgi:hypothetical protein
MSGEKLTFMFLVSGEAIVIGEVKFAGIETIRQSGSGYQVA